MRKVVKYCINKVMKFLYFIDSLFLHSKLQKRISKWALRKAEMLPDGNHIFLRNGHRSNLDSLNVKFSITTEVAANDLLFLQYASPFINPKYLRFDIPLLYDGNIAREIKNDKRIFVDQDFQIIKGVQNFVSAIQSGKEFLDVEVNYIDEWDKRKLFELYDIQYRKDIKKEYHVECDKKITALLHKAQYPFVLILWPSSQNIWESIENDLANICNGSIKIINTTILQFSKKELLGFIDACYWYAGISSETLNCKKNFILDGCNSECIDFQTKLVTFCIDNPHYNIDSHTGQPFSILQKELKMNIRSRYWNEVPNYGYDNIIHGTDNYLQSKLLIELSKIDTDISGLYKLLNRKSCNYSIIKRTKEAHPLSNDPIVNNKIIFNSDIDILTTDSEIQTIAELVRDFASHHFVGEWIIIEEEEVLFNHGREHNRFIWVKLKDFPIVLFHIQSRLYGLSCGFLSECLSHSRKDNLQYVIDIPEYEVYLRLADLLEHPEKKHHQEYVRTYKSLINDERLSDAFGYVNAKEIKKYVAIL